MKTSLKTLLLLPAFIAAPGLILAGRVTAQTFTTLHSFAATSTNAFDVFTNSEGAGPYYGGLILSGNTLYGTALLGGINGNGTVFAVNTDATGFTNVHSFSALVPPFWTNSDGAAPEAGLMLSGNTLYGTAGTGSSSGNGSVFAVNTDGTDFKTLHSFTATSGSNYTNSDGANPSAALIISGNTLYGTALSGGSSGNGTVFKLNTNGTDFKTLYSFTATSGPNYTNSDGSGPYASLSLAGNTLYGAANRGGSYGNGTVFSLNTDGTGFTNLHTFTSTTTGFGLGAGLIISGTTLYGTTGDDVGGTVFAVSTDGTGFMTLLTSRDASNGLILSGNTLYGTAWTDHPNDYGTVFKLNTNGTGFTTLYSFTRTHYATNGDGAYPRAGLVLSGNTLYGTAGDGGSFGQGTVFSLTLPAPPQLTIIPFGANVVLTWPTNAVGFILQSTTNLMSPVWNTNSLAPVIVNGQTTVINPIAGTQQFFRLNQ